LSLGDEIESCGGLHGGAEGGVSERRQIMGTGEVSCMRDELIVCYGLH
jgi:hypothetical protein